MSKPLPWSEQDFIDATGQSPEQDDLERANCTHAGYFGHRSCGVCKAHNLPVFMCSTCFASKEPVERIPHST